MVLHWSPPAMSLAGSSVRQGQARKNSCKETSKPHWFSPRFLGLWVPGKLGKPGETRLVLMIFQKVGFSHLFIGSKRMVYASKPCGFKNPAGVNFIIIKMGFEIRRPAGVSDWKVLFLFLFLACTCSFVLLLRVSASSESRSRPPPSSKYY